MASSSQQRLPHDHHHNQPSFDKPFKTPASVADFDSKNPLPLPNPTITNPIQENLFLSKSTHLTRREVLSRRSRSLKQLSRCYRDHYWGLMEELRLKYREYVWKYGVSPYKEDEEERESFREEIMDGIVEGSGETDNANGGSSNLLCAFHGCKLKAMALTRFCQLHILSDAKQKLYKPCDYVIKSSQAGPITCGKPILLSTIPALCNVHFQKAQRHVTRALKKAGLSVSSSNKLAPKFHVIVAEYIREIQAKRKADLRKLKSKVVVKEECAG